MENSFPSDQPIVQTVVYPAHFESLDNLRGFVGGIAEACDFKEKDVYAVQMAVDEAFTNIVEHAYGGESDENIECICEVDESSLRITLRDCGRRSFNPDEIPEPDLDAPLEERETGGLGLFFMRQLMDDVHFYFYDSEEGENGCNVVTMTKRRVRQT